MARDEQTPPPARPNFAFVRPLGAEFMDEQIDEMAGLLSGAIITGELPEGTHRTQHAEVIVGEVSPGFITWHTSVQSSNARAAARA